MAYIGQSLTEGTRREYTYVATAGQTTFNAVYTVGAVDVYQNGVLLAPADYTATDGTTVVLSSGAALNDEITIHCHNTFSVADTVSASQGGTFNGPVIVTGTFTSRGIDDNATSTAMTLDASGNLLVGTTDVAPASTSALGNYKQGTTISGGSGADGEMQVSAYNQPAIETNRNFSDGALINFRKDGTTVGSIGVKDGTNAFIGSGASGFAFAGAGPTIAPYNTTANNYTDATIDLGNVFNRFKDLYLSGGAYLGGIAAANKLDDYEEGTWTPGINGITVSSNYGRYRKIGSLVIAAYTIRFPTSSSTSPIQITGLPFTNMNDGAGGANLPNFGAALGYTNQGSYFGHHVNNNDTTVNAYSLDGTYAQISQWSNKDIRNVIFYFTE